jgi:hypothetical protein
LAFSCNLFPKSAGYFLDVEAMVILAKAILLSTRGGWYGNMQMAINEARADLAGIATVEGTPAPLIQAPALPSRIKEAIGTFSLAPLLKASIPAS